MTANEIDAELFRLDTLTRFYCGQRDRALMFGRTAVAARASERLRAIDAERRALAEFMDIEDDDIAAADAVRKVERMVGFRALFVALALSLLATAGVFAGVL